MKNNRNVKAVVLAAGIGSRLSEITKKIPKTMIEIKGRYIFEIIIDALVSCNIGEVIFVVGYQHNKLVPIIRNACARNKLSVNFVINPKYRETNTMYSLWLARKHLDVPFIYLHGDLVVEDQLLRSFLDSSSRNAVLVDKCLPIDWDDAMKVISHKGEIKYMSKAITINESDGTAIGIYKFDRRGGNELLAISGRLIKEGIEKSWISEAINILSKTIRVREEVNRHNSLWFDVDNLDDLHSAEKIVEMMGT